MSITSRAKRCADCGDVISFMKDENGRWRCLEVREWRGPQIDPGMPVFQVEFDECQRWDGYPNSRVTLHVLHTARPGHGHFRRAR